MAYAAVVLGLLLTAGPLFADATLAKSRSEILQLGAKLTGLERELGAHNNRYLAAIERIRVLETDLVAYQERLTEVRREAQRRETELSAILRAQALAAVEDDVVPDRAYAELLATNRARAESALKETAALENITAEFQARLQTLQQDEQELAKLTADLEARKGQLTETYLTKLDERQRLEEKWQKQKISTQLSALKRAEVSGAAIPPTQKFAFPLKSVSEMLSSEKGVTYKLNAAQPLFAPRAGRVIYNGELSTYGKVLMIDHGDDIRSVLLGRFSSALEKNAQVAAGAVLGQMESDADSLYFEVRKKNVAQKTIHWLETQAVGKI